MTFEITPIEDNKHRLWMHTDAGTILITDGSEIKCNNVKTEIEKDLKKTYGPKQ